MQRADRDALSPCRHADVLPPSIVETRGLFFGHLFLNPACIGQAIRSLESAEGV